MKEKLRSDRPYIIPLILLCYLIIWVSLQVPTLTSYPFVHSDEPWLSGLSRNMMETGDIGVTEPFFDTYARAPHAIKLLFHTIQMGAISVFGYSITTVRAISLLFAVLSLFMSYLLLRSLRCSKVYSLLGVILLSVNLQFIYISHLARQEILLVFLMIITSWLIIRKQEQDVTLPYRIMTGVLCGLSVGIHPNGALICITSVVLMYCCWNEFKRTILEAILPMGVTVLVFLIISLVINPDFFSTYSSYGETLGVQETVFTKIGRYPEFYWKLYHGVSGTYYTPPIRWVLIILGLSYPAAIIGAVADKRLRAELLPIICALTVLHLGFILIGRYGQPSVIIFLPYSGILFLLMVRKMHLIQRQLPIILLSLLILASGYHSWDTVTDTVSEQSDYDEYLDFIEETIPDGSVVLGNLNTEYAFPAGGLYDWRNLAPAIRAGMDFSEYVSERGIDHIIYSDELDVIYDRRPMWNSLYGNVYLYYEQMQEFIDESCVLEASFTSPTYAMRIVRLADEQPWGIRIYSVR